MPDTDEYPGQRIGLPAEGSGSVADYGRRIAALVIAFLSAVSNFAFLPQAPFWSIAIIGFDVLVIWALVAELNESS